MPCFRNNSAKRHRGGGGRGRGGNGRGGKRAGGGRGGKYSGKSREPTSNNSTEPTHSDLNNSHEAVEVDTIVHLHEWVESQVEFTLTDQRSLDNPNLPKL